MNYYIEKKIKLIKEMDWWVEEMSEPVEMPAASHNPFKETELKFNESTQQIGQLNINFTELITSKRKDNLILS